MVRQGTVNHQLLEKVSNTTARPATTRSLFFQNFLLGLMLIPVLNAEEERESARAVVFIQDSKRDPIRDIVADSVIVGFSAIQKNGKHPSLPVRTATAHMFVEMGKTFSNRVPFRSSTCVRSAENTSVLVMLESPTTKGNGVRPFWLKKCEWSLRCKGLPRQSNKQSFQLGFASQILSIQVQRTPLLSDIFSWFLRKDIIRLFPVFFEKHEDKESWV